MKKIVALFSLVLSFAVCAGYAHFVNLLPDGTGIVVEYQCGEGALMVVAPARDVHCAADSSMVYIDGVETGTYDGGEVCGADAKLRISVELDADGVATDSGECIVP